MITIDNRDGSSQFAPLLKQRGLPVVLGRLGYGDASFIGSGPAGLPVPVGIEIKQVMDLLACMTDGRLAGHQLPGLVQSYDQVWLLIIGEIRPCPKTGVLQRKRLTSGQWVEAGIGQRRFMYKDLLTFIFTLSIKGNVLIHITSSLNEAIVWISTLYNWWTVKTFEEHRSHLSLHNAQDGRMFDRAILTRPSTLRLVATQLPGIGYDKSLSLSNFFGTVENLVVAEQWEIEQVPGVGKELARKIYLALRSK